MNISSKCGRPREITQISLTDPSAVHLKLHGKSWFLASGPIEQKMYSIFTGKPTLNISANCKLSNKLYGTYIYVLSFISSPLLGSARRHMQLAAVSLGSLVFITDWTITVQGYTIQLYLQSFFSSLLLLTALAHRVPINKAVLKAMMCKVQQRPATNKLLKLILLVSVHYWTLHTCLHSITLQAWVYIYGPFTNQMRPRLPKITPIWWKTCVVYKTTNALYGSDASTVAVLFSI